MDIQRVIKTLFPWVGEKLSLRKIQQYNHQSFPLYEEKPIEKHKWTHTVEKTSEWRLQKKALIDSGIEEIGQGPFHSFFHCYLCGIHIGLGHYEQHLYCYPVYKQHVYSATGDCYKYFENLTCLNICKGCARHRSRMLPDWLEVITSDHYILPDCANYLKRMAETLSSLLVTFYTHLLFLLMWALGLPTQPFIELLRRNERQDNAQKKEDVVENSLYIVQRSLYIPEMSV